MQEHKLFHEVDYVYSISNVIWQKPFFLTISHSLLRLIDNKLLNRTDHTD